MSEEFCLLKHSQVGLDGGHLDINDMEIEYMMRIYAQLGAGYNHSRHKTVGFQRVHRGTKGEKLWEEKTMIEQRCEFFQRLKEDLEFAAKEMKANKVNHLLDRALDPLDPMSGFYKVLLVKLGATIAEDGRVRIPNELKQRLETRELRNRQVMDLMPPKIVQQEWKMHLPPQGPILKLVPRIDGNGLV
jgi:hypothetical protein